LAAPGRQRLIMTGVAGSGVAAPVERASVSPAGAISVVFSPGAASGPPGSEAVVALAESNGAVGKPVPAIVTRSFLAATGQRIGAPVQVGVAGAMVDIVPVLAVANIPTITDGSPAVLIDQASLNDALQAVGVAPPPANEWWLRTSGPPVLTGLPPGASVSSRAEVAQSLVGDPLSKAAQQALLAIAIAAVLLAAIGLLVSVATAAERARDAALLDALGMPTGQVARLLGLEQASTVVVTGAIGMVLGAALAELIVPAVTLTQQATRPVPPTVVQMPWLLASAVVLVLVAAPTLTTMIGQPRRTSAAARIRYEDET